MVQGFWERLIGQGKRCLKKVLERTTFRTFTSCKQEIELILNSRPFGGLHDGDTEQILTPNHLLFGRKLNLENVRSDFNLKNKVELKKYVNHTNNLLTHFWNRSRSEYVLTPREYQKVYRRTNNIKPSIGDIVHIHGDKSGY